MIGLMLIYTVYLIIQIQGARYGTGRHRIDLSPEDNRNALLCWYICELLYIISTCLLKISVGYFLLRVSVRRAHIWTLRLLMLVTVLFGATYFFMFLLQCGPISTFWEQSPRVADKCFNNNVILAMTYTASIINCLADWAFGILPLFILWSLSLPKQTRLLAFSILSFAAIGSIATIIRLVYIPTLLDGDDFLWSTTDLVLWSTVEPGIGITAASIATLRPLWRLMGSRSGSSPQTPRAVVWRERFQAKPSYVRSDGSDPRQNPQSPMPNYASPNENVALPHSVFQTGLPLIPISQNRFSLATESQRSRLSKNFETPPPVEDQLSIGSRQTAKNVPSNDAESLVTSHEESDGGRWLCPSLPDDRDEDYDSEAEDGFNLTLMTTTHGAPTINWSSPRMSIISLGFGPSIRDSAHSAAPSRSLSKCNGKSRISKISSSIFNYSNSSRASKSSRRSNIMHSSSIRANSIRANSIRANSIRANSTRASRLSSVSNANDFNDDADGYTGTPAISRSPSLSPSLSPHHRSGGGGSPGMHGRRQRWTALRSSSHYSQGSQFLAPPSLDFQMPSPPPSVWRGSNAVAGDMTNSAQWLSSRMAEHPGASLQ
ncbi:hypothetical protein LZ32DRAFT_632413 [Colletotrichum eremochloae]|nr:hypothetical protein LZ32DRAFT_632413 [Colletotrichum eremochloae]